MKKKTKIRKMKGVLFFIISIALFQICKAQDSLKLVLPLGHSYGIRSIDYSYDGLFIASISDHTLKIWDRKSLKEIKSLSFEHNLQSVYFLPNKFKKNINDLSVIIVFENVNKNPVFLLNIISGRKKYFEINEEIEQISINSNRNQFLIISNKKKEIKLFDIRDRKLLNVLKLDSKLFNKAIFDHGGKKVISITEDKSIIVWDVFKGVVLQELKGHLDRVFNLEINSDDTYLLSSSFDNTARLWNLAKKGTFQKSYSIDEGFKSPTSFNVNSDLLLISTSFDTSNLYDFKTGYLYMILKGNEGHFGSNSKFVYTISSYSSLSNTHDSLNVWDIINKKKIGCFAIEFDNTPTYSKDGKYLSWVSDRTVINELDLQNGLLRTCKKKAIWVEFSTISNDKKYVVSVPNRTNSTEIKGDNIIQLWELTTGKIKQFFQGNRMMSTPAEFSSDDHYLINGSYDNTAIIWDVVSGKQIKSIIGKHDVIVKAEFSKNNKYVLLTQEKNHTGCISRPSIYYLNDLTEPSFTKKYERNCESILINKKGDKVVLTIYDTIKMEEIVVGEVIDHVEFGSLLKGEFYKEFEYKKENIRTVITSPDDQNVFIITDSEIDVLESSNYKIKYSIPMDNCGPIYFSSDNKKWYACKYNHKGVRQFDVETGKEILPALNNLEYQMGQIYSDDGGFLFNKINDSTIVNWDTKKDTEKSRISNNGTILFFYLLPKTNTILTIDDNYKTVIWDSESGKPVYERFILENNNWLIKLPNSPYYMCSKDASKLLHYVTPSLKVIGFDQLDPIYNRPDIVLDSIGKYFAGGPDLKLIQQYKEAWVKRMVRLGLDTTTSSNAIEVPDAEIVNADDIVYNNTSGKINFHFKASDAKHDLRRYNVYVNEVPVYGSNGISISEKVNQFEKDISLNLTEGNNKIQVSVMNDLGLENFRYPVYVQYQPAKPIVSKTFYIGIGVDSFATSKFNLQYCVKDVNDLGNLLANDKNTKTIILKNKDVTKENVLKLKSFLQQTTEQDKVIISCSSHGLLDKNNNFYLAMNNVDFNHPELNGLAYEDLQGLLDGIPARKKLLLLDACNSGENEKSDNNGLANSKDLAIKQGAKGVEIESVSDSSQNKKNSFETMMELFVNVNNQTGATVVSAAGGKQSALEGGAVYINGKPISNGAFTYSILEYLTQHQNDKNKLTVNQLKQYAEQRVTEITNGKQKPTSRQETMEVDWGF